IMRGIGSSNNDHRLRPRDDRDQAADPAYPSLRLGIAAVENLDALLVIGSNLRREVPMLAHRVRKAALRGAQIAFVNPARFDYQFHVAEFIDASPAKLVGELAAILAASLAESQHVPEHVASLVRAARIEARHRAVATVL